MLEPPFRRCCSSQFFIFTTLFCRQRGSNPMTTHTWGRPARDATNFTVRGEPYRPDPWDYEFLTSKWRRC
jgi:hypothetical protein